MQHVRSSEQDGVVEVDFLDGEIVRRVRLEASETNTLEQQHERSARDVSTRSLVETKMGRALPASIVIRRTRSGVAVVVGDSRVEEFDDERIR